MERRSLNAKTLRNGQGIVRPIVVIPRPALVVERHVQLRGRGWHHCEARPGPVRGARHDGAGDAVPVVVAPVQGDARCAGGQAAIIENLHRLGMDRRAGAGGNGP